MDKIKDEVQAVLDDMVLTIGGVVVRMALGEFGKVPDEAMYGIAGAFGCAVADVQLRADPAAGKRMEERRDLSDRGV